MNWQETLMLITPVIAIVSNVVVGAILNEHIKQQKATIQDLKINSDMFNPDKIKALVEFQSNKIGNEKADKIIWERLEGKNFNETVKTYLAHTHAEMYVFIVSYALDNYPDLYDRNVFLRDTFPKNCDFLITLCDNAPKLDVLQTGQ